MNKILKFALPLALLSAAQAVQAQVLTEEARMPKVAGQFYPDDPVELQELVQELFQRQTAPAGSRKPKILIVPHAGYQYSGLVAAAGFRQVQGQHYDGVVVVGFTHRQQFPGASVDTREVYQTPLGEIPVDQEAVAVLLAQPGLGHFEEAHESGEHSLEVELPFLQVALGRFKLVPVLMGNADAASASRLAAALAKLDAMGDYLFVFSSDLSHYHAYDDASGAMKRPRPRSCRKRPRPWTGCSAPNSSRRAGAGRS